MCNTRRFYCLRELYEVDFHKPGIYGSGRAWAKAWDVFHHRPSRGGPGRRAAVDFVVCFRWVGISFFCRLFFFERTRPAASMRPSCLIYLSASSGTLQHLCRKSSSAGPMYGEKIERTEIIHYHSGAYYRDRSDICDNILATLLLILY